MHLPAAAGGTRGAGRHQRLGWHGQKPETGWFGAPGPPGGWVSKPAACCCALRPRIGVMKVMLEEGGSKEATIAIPKLMGAPASHKSAQAPRGRAHPAPRWAGRHVPDSSPPLTCFFFSSFLSLLPLRQKVSSTSVAPASPPGGAGPVPDVELRGPPRRAPRAPWFPFIANNNRSGSPRASSGMSWR